MNDFVNYNISQLNNIVKLVQIMKNGMNLSYDRIMYAPAKINFYCYNNNRNANDILILVVCIYHVHVRLYIIHKY